MTAVANLPRITPSAVDALGFNLDETFTMDTSGFTEEYKLDIPKLFVMGEAVQVMISEINKAIEEQLSSGASLQDNRTISLKIPFGSKLYYYDQYCGVPSAPQIVSRDQVANTWANRILKALKDHQYIKNSTLASDGYRIQV